MAQVNEGQSGTDDERHTHDAADKGTPEDGQAA